MADTKQILRSTVSGVVDNERVLNFFLLSYRGFLNYLRDAHIQIYDVRRSCF